MTRIAAILMLIGLLRRGRRRPRRQGSAALCQPARRQGLSARRPQLCPQGAVGLSPPRLSLRGDRQLRCLAAGAGGGRHGGLDERLHAVRPAHRAGDGQGPGADFREAPIRRQGGGAGRSRRDRRRLKACAPDACHIRGEGHRWLDRRRTASGASGADEVFDNRTQPLVSAGSGACR